MKITLLYTLCSSYDIATDTWDGVLPELNIARSESIVKVLKEEESMCSVARLFRMNF